MAARARPPPGAGLARPGPGPEAEVEAGAPEPLRRPNGSDLPRRRARVDGRRVAYGREAAREARALGHGLPEGADRRRRGAPGGHLGVRARLETPEGPQPRVRAPRVRGRRLGPRDRSRPAATPGPRPPPGAASPTGPPAFPQAPPARAVRVLPARTDLTRGAAPGPRARLRRRAPGPGPGPVAGAPTVPRAAPPAGVGRLGAPPPLTSLVEDVHSAPATIAPPQWCVWEGRPTGPGS